MGRIRPSLGPDASPSATAGHAFDYDTPLPPDNTVHVCHIQSISSGDALLSFTFFLTGSSGSCQTQV